MHYLVDVCGYGIGRSSFRGHSSGGIRQLFDGRVVFLVGLPSFFLVPPACLLGIDVPVDNGMGIGNVISPPERAY